MTCCCSCGEDRAANLPSFKSSILHSHSTFLALGNLAKLSLVILGSVYRLTVFGVTKALHLIACGRVKGAVRICCGDPLPHDEAL